jgi:hypothetical protein
MGLKKFKQLRITNNKYCGKFTGMAYVLVHVLQGQVILKRSIYTSNYFHPTKQNKIE